MAKVSAVINVIREEVPLLPRLLNSVVGLVDDIAVIDMTEGDENLEKVAADYGANLYQHKIVPYVEMARNYGLSKAKGDWILLLDPDEELTASLVAKLKKIVANPPADYFRLPRKNIIFGKWIQHCRFWPDYNIRFFKRRHVIWSEIIHSVPETRGKGLDFEAKEEYAITHHNYGSINQYLVRMDRYTTAQAAEIAKTKYKFIWMDLIRKPASEFFSRYFAGEGYKDGLHGLAISLLQTFSETLVYLKVWEKEKFLEQGVTPNEIAKEFGQTQADLNWWINDMLIKSSNLVASLPLRVKRKILNKKNG